MNDTPNSVTCKPGSIKSPHLLYVASSKKSAAVNPPGTSKPTCVQRNCTTHTFDWRERPGGAANTHKIKPEFHGFPIAQALGSDYDSEAHFCAYTVTKDGKPLGRQPRVSKGGLAWMREQGYEVHLTTLMADIDTPGHTEWTQEQRLELKALLGRSPPVLGTTGLYMTKRGYRLLQPLLKPVLVDESEGYIQAWLNALVAVGVWDSVLECKDWTRLMRTPHYVREVDGVKESVRCLAWGLTCMEAIDITDMDTTGITPVKVKQGRALMPGQLAEIARMRNSGWVHPAYTTTYPEAWTDFTRAVGLAIKKHWVNGGAWRDVYMLIAGALARDPRVDVVHIPAMIQAIHAWHEGEEYPHLSENRVAMAFDSIERVCTGHRAGGIPEMDRRFPEVLNAYRNHIPCVGY